MIKTAAIVRKRFYDKMAALGDVGSDAYRRAAVPATLIKRIKSRFERQVDPEGKPWAPRKDQSNKEDLLVDTTSLYDSIKVVQQDGRPYTNTGFGFRIGAPARSKRSKDGFHYGLSHQNGAVIRRNAKGKPVVKIPRRRFLGINKMDVSVVMRRMTAEADKILRGL